MFLLNCRFMPVVKWIHRAVADLPLLGAVVYTQISELLSTADPGRQAGLMEYMVGQAIQAIQDQGLSDVTSDFLMDHAPVIHEKIRDTGLRERLTVVQ